MINADVSDNDELNILFIDIYCMLIYGGGGGGDDDDDDDDDHDDDDDDDNDDDDSDYEVNDTLARTTCALAHFFSHQSIHNYVSLHHNPVITLLSGNVEDFAVSVVDVKSSNRSSIHMIVK